jgi:hypothetical protein
VKPRAVRLPDGRVWLRVADPEWRDSLDPSHAQRQGGRWNPPGSFPALYLNADVTTARLQIGRLLAGSPVRMDDLDDGAYVLVAAVLPAEQAAADACSRGGLGALRLPASYPLDPEGNEIPHRVCQEMGARIRETGLRGVWCRSACTPDGQGRELAWFPATPRSRARPVWDAPLPLGSWRDAVSWSELGLGEQEDPRPR